MLKILVKDKIDPLVVEELKRRKFSVREGEQRPDAIYQEVQQNEILIIRSATNITRELIDSALKTGLLKVIIRAGVGVDNIDVDYTRSRGIEVFNTPEASSESVAELALAHIFVLARKIVPANLTMKNGEWNKNDFLGMELSGKIMGIIGMGRVGKALARKASALGMRIIYYDIKTPEGVESSWQSLPLEEVLKQSDFISLHVSPEKNNGYLIDRAQFRMMKKNAFLINTARGRLVNEDALLEALDNNEIAGAGIDVYCQEPCNNIVLLRHDRISVTPHIGASTREAQYRIGQEIIQLIEDYQDKKKAGGIHGIY